MPHRKFNACIEACNTCSVACNDCAASCLQESDVKMMARCIAHDMDCAQACVFAASVIARGSAHCRSVCTLCAEICEACASECAKHEAKHCQWCAKACRACAAECRKRPRH
ncbi:MAG: four-helix bundle copper-binding protein [Betaproteobacteria bacterium]